ncbi:MAG: hypothetical protein JWQ09_5841 [Segetibacter sp.]|nr:hypothetical protein [Segetibacter sp.]
MQHKPHHIKDHVKGQQRFNQAGAVAALSYQGFAWSVQRVFKRYRFI